MGRNPECSKKVFHHDYAVWHTPQDWCSKMKITLYKSGSWKAWYFFHILVSSGQSCQSGVPLGSTLNCELMQTTRACPLYRLARIQFSWAWQAQISQIRAWQLAAKFIVLNTHVELASSQAQICRLAALLVAHENSYDSLKRDWLSSSTICKLRSQPSINKPLPRSWFCQIN